MKMTTEPKRWLAAGAVLLAALAPVAARAQTAPVSEITLGNGMKALLLERHDEPSITGGWVAHVGSANERPGITGIAHLFEHMMFKGTETIGTKDYRKDQAIIAAQERVRDDMRAEERKVREAYRRGDIDDPAKPENMTPRWRELKKRFDDLVAQQRQILVKNEYDQVYTAQGGSRINAFTTEDMTAYFVTVPANKLELWMWMESERIRRPVFREFYAERDVVFEERRMRTESTPLGRFGEESTAMFWESVPYGWPVLGWPSDIPAISKAQADDFFATYYAPQNLTLILVGDLGATNTVKLLRKYFERIPRGKRDVPDVGTLEVKQVAEKRMYAAADANPQVDIYWHTVPFGHKDSYPLRVLAELLSTRTGRLHKGLVLGSHTATDTSASQDSRQWAGAVNIWSEAREGHAPEEVEQGIYAQLERLKREDVPAEELQKVKNAFAAGEFRKLSGNYAIFMELVENDGEGDWREINNSNPKIQAVTAADLKRVVNQYFTRENRFVGVYTRKTSAPAAAKEDAQ